MSTPFRTACSASLLAVTCIACSGPRGGSALESVNNDASSCAAVLPAALRAVGNHGTLVALHPVRRGHYDAAVRALGEGSPKPAPKATHRPASRPPSNLPKACIVAYRGTWRRGELALAPQQSGRFAVVLLTVRHPKVRRLLLTDQLPPGL